MPSRTLLLARSVSTTLVAVALFTGGCSRTQAPSPSTTTLPTVVVISFDALGDRFLDRDSLPNFARLAAEGVRAPFRPEFPSKTFPNHYSMATGLTPGQHGIVAVSYTHLTLPTSDLV